MAVDTLEANSIFSILAGSAVISAIVGGTIANRRATRLKQKELIAGATRSALQRVEMYYRIRRRTKNESDSLKIRDTFHNIQEENDYYIALLQVESIWLGAAYTRFISALKKETMGLIQTAWDEDPMGASARLEGVVKPNYEKIERYRSQFAKDGRRFFNPIMRSWMRIKYTLRKYIKDDGYGL